MKAYKIDDPYILDEYRTSCAKANVRWYGGWAVTLIIFYIYSFFDSFVSCTPKRTKVRMRSYRKDFETDRKRIIFKRPVKPRSIKCTAEVVYYCCSCSYSRLPDEVVILSSK